MDDFYNELEKQLSALYLASPDQFRLQFAILMAYVNGHPASKVSEFIKSVAPELQDSDQFESFELLIEAYSKAILPMVIRVQMLIEQQKAYLLESGISSQDIKKIINHDIAVCCAVVKGLKD